MLVSYASARFPEPRPFQKAARELLRSGFAAGHRCQMVISPTGSGKTILAMFLIHEALLRSKRVNFVADCRTLINQTSEVADSLGLSHGVLMADRLRKVHTKGAATAGGEWSDHAASQRGMQIIGNVARQAEQAIIGALLRHSDVIAPSGTLEPHRLCLKCTYLDGAADARRCALAVPLDEWLAGLAPLAEDGDE
jgi:superfamily II DNA or RNA helicase